MVTPLGSTKRGRSEDEREMNNPSADIKRLTAVKCESTNKRRHLILICAPVVSHCLCGAVVRLVVQIGVMAHLVNTAIWEDI